MQQIIIRDQMMLSMKAEQLQCREHGRPITLLYLNSRGKQLNKLACSECRARLECSVFQINRIEEYLYNWYRDEQQKIQQIESVFSNILRTSQELVKKFNSYMNIQIQSLQQELQYFVQSTQLTFIQETVNTIANENRIGESIFQQILSFLADQEINNNQIELRTKSDFKMLISQELFESSQKIINIYQSIQYISERDFNWQQRIKEAIKNFQLFSLNSETTIPIKAKTDLQKYVNYNGPSYISDSTFRGIYALAISYDDKYLAIGDSQGHVSLWDLLEQKKLKEYKCSKYISAVAFSKNSKLLAASLKGDTENESVDIQLFNLEQLSFPKAIQRIYNKGSNVFSLIFTNDSKYLIAGGMLRVWDLETIQCIETQSITKISSFAISSNQKYIVCGCWVSYGQAYLLNCQQLTKIQQVVNWKSSEKSAVFKTMVAFSPDDSKIIIGSDGIKLWNVQELTQSIIQPCITIKIQYPVKSMHLGFNGNIIIYQDNTSIQFYSSENGQHISTIGIEKKSNIYQARATQNMRILVASYLTELVIYKNSLY